MANENNVNDDERFGAATGTQMGRVEQSDVKPQKGGTEADRISGETQKGAQNQDAENRNPQGNNQNQKGSATQKG